MNLKRVFTIVFLVLIVVKIIVLLGYSFHYVDDDQALMWYGSTEFTKGYFHEPKFFGQNYGTMFESLLAVPLVFARVPVNIALPIISTIIGILPYIIVSLVMIRKGNYFTATLSLLVPMSLSINYDILTSIPRSFTPGILMATIGAVLLLDYHNSKLCIFLGGFLFLLGYTFNPASLVISIIVITWCILDVRFKNSSTIIMFLGIILGLVVHIAMSLFYVYKPEWNLHGDIKIAFSFKVLLQNLQRLDMMFNEITPFINHGLFLVFLFSVFVVVAIIIKKKNLFIISMLSFVGIIGCLGISKINDFQNDVLFSKSRMLLGIPILIVIILKLFDFDSIIFPKIRKSNLILNIIIVITLMLFSYKTMSFFNNYEEFTHSKVLSVMKVQDVYNISNEVLNYAKINKCELIVFKDVYCSRLLTYAVEALSDGKIKTYSSIYERRTWRYIEESTNIRAKFMLIGSFYPNALEYSVINTNGRTVVKWLEEETGDSRRPNGTKSNNKKVKSLINSTNTPTALKASYQIMAIEDVNDSRVKISIKYKNIGQAIWLSKALNGKGIVRLGYRWYRKDGQELTNTYTQSNLLFDVKPGDEFVFNDIIKKPDEKGEYLLKIGLVSELVVWFEDIGTNPILIDFKI